MGNSRPYVFGLDIGTRSIVGTVGYKQDEDFYVVGQVSREHDTRSMLDGQIHDIRKVGITINEVKEALEKQLDLKLKDVCIAAAGRVLRTITTHVDQAYDDDREIQEEDIYELASSGVEKAYGEFMEVNTDTDIVFYCVGYSIIRYYLNDYPIANLEGHKAKKIGCDLIATFLPEDVVDGLYKSVGQAELSVANMTLEPIAAIQVAIPQRFRMLNIALVDVGAGTSDISVTNDGSIIAYGMIPIAGDAITETIAHHCLVEFSVAERIKRQCTIQEEMEYEDIIGNKMKITAKEVQKVAGSVVMNMARQVAEKIKELNGDKSVGAVFVVGGGGKFPGYTNALAGELGITPDRVVLRGEEVMDNIHFPENSNIKKDSLLVTPIGICLSFYEHSTNFIFVSFNGTRVKLYDNSRLVVVDAAMQAKFPNKDLFPKRGPSISYTVNGLARMTRGESGEAAVITVNGQPADLYTAIHENDVIEVKESTAGPAASLELRALPEWGGSINVTVNEQNIVLPQFASVNGNMQSEYYDVKDGDDILFLNYYTLEQIAAVMDVVPDTSLYLYVNNKRASLDTKVYENFSVIWTTEELKISDVERDEEEAARLEAERAEAEITGDTYNYDSYADLPEDDAQEEEETSGGTSGEERIPDERESESSDAQQNDANKASNNTSDVNDINTVSEKQPLSDEEAKKDDSTETVKNDSDANNNTESDTGSSQDAPVESTDANKDKTTSDISSDIQNSSGTETKDSTSSGDDSAQDSPSAEEEPVNNEPRNVTVLVNKAPVTLKGKPNYVFVDIFEYIDFDLSKPQGLGIVTNLNGRSAQYMEYLKDGDVLDIYWQ